MALALTWPVGQEVKLEGSNIRRAPLSPVAAYAFAAAIGGTLTGLAIGAGALLLRRSSAGVGDTLTIAAAGVGLLAIALQWRGGLQPLPERKAQVPRRWLLWRRPAVTAAAFGLMIDAGALTHLRYASAYVLAVLVFLAPSALAAAS